MAGAEKLNEKILSEARLQADSITEQAALEAKEILDQADKEARVIREEALIKAENDAKVREKRMISVAELEGRKAILAAKQEIIEELFSKSIEKLVLLSDAEYEKTLLDMICECAAGDEEVLLSQRDLSRMSPDFITKANSKLMAAGKHGGLTLSQEPRLINGGFILRTGNVEINNSFSSIMKTQRENLETIAVKMLF